MGAKGRKCPSLHFIVRPMKRQEQSLALHDATVLLLAVIAFLYVVSATGESIDLRFWADEHSGRELKRAFRTSAVRTMFVAFGRNMR